MIRIILVTLRRVSIIVFCYTLFASPFVNAQNYSNPISDLADPHIVFANGFYYLTGTTGPDIHIRRSPTLVGLKTAPAVRVFVPASGPGQPNQIGWAPELHFLDGKWYIYITASDNSDGNNARIWALENSNSNPQTSNWIVKGALRHPTEDRWMIDGTILDIRGARYLVWTGKNWNTDTNGAIYISRMSNPWTLTGPRTRLCEPEYDWEKVGAPCNEGPEVLTKNGKVFITYSASMYYSADYCLGMLTMNNDTWDPLNKGSWAKANQPVFRRNDAIDMLGTGHNCFFKSPDGSEDWLGYHALQYVNNSSDFVRFTHAQKINWNGDGTPNFGSPVKPGLTLPAPSGEVGLIAGNTIPNGVYRLTPRVNLNSALDLQYCSPRAASSLIEYQWANNNCQKWNLQSTGDGYYTITSAHSGFAIEIPFCSTEPNQLSLWGPNAGICQQWKVESVGDGFYKLVNRNSGKVMDVTGGNPNNNTAVIQYDWLGGFAQHWKLELLQNTQTPVNEGIVSGAVYKIKGKQSGRLMGASGQSTALGTTMQIWDDVNFANQKWKVEDVGGGFVKITAMHSGLALDVPGGSMDNSVRVIQWDYWGGPMQQWKIEPAGDGFYKVTSRISGKCLDVEGFQISNGTYVSQYTFNNTDNQKWKFERVNVASRLAPEETPTQATKVLVYPNPGDGSVNLDWGGLAYEDVNITIVNTKGEQVQNQIGKGGKIHTINTKNLKAGIYTVTLKGKTFVQKQRLVINH